MALVLTNAEMNAELLSDFGERRILTGRNLMIACVHAKAGAQFAAHSHPEEQMGYIVSGRIEFFIGEAEQPTMMESGTFFRFAPNERHGSRVLEDVTIIDVFSPPRPEYKSRSAPPATQATGD